MQSGKLHTPPADISRNSYPPIPDELATTASERPGSQNRSASVETGATQAISPPTMRAKPAESLDSWTELMPQDVRLLTLSALVQQRDTRFLAKDLSSYACTSKLAADDVRNFHQIYRDPRVSLLASRHLIRHAWELAKMRGFFYRTDYFESLIKASASVYSAAIVDGRINCQENSSFAGIANKFLGQLLQTEIDYVHLRLGYPDIGIENSDYAPDHEDALVPISILSNGSLQRLRQGRPVPSAFLDITGVTPDQVAGCLGKSLIRMSITGFSLCSDHRHLQDKQKVQSPGTGLQSEPKIQRIPMFALSRDAWDLLFSQLKTIRYLDLSGWGGASLADPLADFISRTAHLKALHLSDCQFSEQDLRRIIRAIRQQASMELLYLGKIEPPSGAGLQDAFEKLLTKLPKIKIILGAPQTPEAHPRLAGYRLAGRVVFDTCLKVERDLPEIYRGVDLFKPAI